MKCPACRLLPSRGSDRAGYDLCQGCGSYLSDRTQQYDENYWPPHGGLDGHRKLVTSDRLSWWLERVRARGRILEVGCAPGALLDALVARGDDARGVDPTMPASDRVLAGEFPDVSWPGPFSAVVMLDVLEHMADPAAALRHARSVLDPGGVLYLQLPTLRGGPIEGRFWLAGEHTWIPTQFGLSLALELAGFEVTRCDETWHAGHEWTEAVRT